MGSKKWSKEDKLYLEERWGEISIPSIAKAIGRTVAGVKIKAWKLGLGRHIHSGEYITMNQLFNALGIGSGSYVRMVWIQKGLPVKNKISIKQKFKVIYLVAFWKWAKKNKMLIDFSKFEENSLGEEPDWVKEKRKADYMFKKYKVTPWTPAEDNLLKSMLNNFCYSYREISLRLLRTEGAIKKRMNELNIKQRPLKAENHNAWTPEEIKILEDMYYIGYKAEVIAESINRSALAIKGKIERMENEGLLLKRVI